MAATKPAFTPPGKKGDMIFSALVKLAALIVLDVYKRQDVKRSRATYSTSTLVCWSVLRVLTPNTLKPSPKVK